MAETRRERPQAPEEFTRETVLEIEGVKSTGAATAEDIAMALNRSGYTNFRGHQWTPDEVMEFLSNDTVRRIQRELRGEIRGG
ncbi:MAG TPA: hypothetical protein VM325_19805 [Alphaproteobacteria bacterium]|nr:hypothetical protein [Alphaproteobacteria bacterium]